MNATRNLIKALLSTLCMFAIASISAADARPSAADIQAHNKAITDAIGGVGTVKDAVANYRLHHEGFPGSNAEAGIPPGTAFASSALKRIEVGKNGMIEETLTADSGVDDGVIRFIPAMSAQTDLNQIEWTCTTPSYSGISDISTCTYGKNP